MKFKRIFRSILFSGTLISNISNASSLMHTEGIQALSEIIKDLGEQKELSENEVIDLIERMEEIISFENFKIEMKEQNRLLDERNNAMAGRCGGWTGKR